MSLHAQQLHLLDTNCCTVRLREVVQSFGNLLLPAGQVHESAEPRCRRPHFQLSLVSQLLEKDGATIHHLFTQSEPLCYLSGLLCKTLDDLLLLLLLGQLLFVVALGLFGQHLHAARGCVGSEDGRATHLPCELVNGGAEVRPFSRRALRVHALRGKATPLAGVVETMVLQDEAASCADEGALRSIDLYLGTAFAIFAGLAWID
mmetsp:Transcript_109569/g.261327  ORF Transcript_109569/g.261327 Transcript_109569/m.261327 type:complete len:204 (+) Transcript_109569:441-1052(+)